MRADIRRALREDAAEFAALEATWVDELASVRTLQIVLTRRVAVAASRRARADRLAAGTGLGPRSPTGGQQTELFAERRWDNAGVGIAPILDADGGRSS